MRIKYTADLLNHAAEMMKTMTLTETAKALGATRDNLSQLLRAMGVPTRGVVYRPAHHAKDYPRDLMVSLYGEGWSVKRLAEHFGVPRMTIRRQLVRSGVKPRNRSESMFVRMAATSEEIRQKLTATSEEIRQKLTAAAHDAVRGVPHSTEDKIKSANARKQEVGLGEQLLAEHLRNLGIQFEAQAPIYIYNIDILVAGRIAVEPTSRSPHSAKDPRSAKWAKRVEYLAHRGISTLSVRYQRVADLIRSFDYVVANIHGMSGNPPPVGEYRMIWCGRKASVVRRYDDAWSAIPSSVDADDGG